VCPARGHRAALAQGSAARMKLLMLNPNATRKVTDRVAQAARAAAPPGTEIISATGRFGRKVIGSRSEVMYQFS